MKHAQDGTDCRTVKERRQAVSSLPKLGEYSCIETAADGNSVPYQSERLADQEFRAGSPQSKWSHGGLLSRPYTKKAASSSPSYGIRVVTLTRV